MLKFQIFLYFLLLSVFCIYNAVFFNLFSYKQAKSDTQNKKFETQIRENSAIIKDGIEIKLLPAAFLINLKTIFFSKAD